MDTITFIGPVFSLSKAGINVEIKFMKNSKKLISMFGLIAIVIGSFMAGCQESAKEPVPGFQENPVLFPSPPDKARIQFLMSISGSSDLEGNKKKGGFESFIAGQEGQEDKYEIAKPYGGAICDGKLYICDAKKRAVDVIDIAEGTFSRLPRGGVMTNPINVYVDERGSKWFADSIGEQVVVYGRDDELKATLAKDKGIKAIDVETRGNRCYIVDMNCNQVVVIDTVTNTDPLRMGRRSD